MISGASLSTCSNSSPMVTSVSSLNGGSMSSVAPLMSTRTPPSMSTRISLVVLSPTVPARSTLVPDLRLLELVDDADGPRPLRADPVPQVLRRSGVDAPPACSHWPDGCSPGSGRALLRQIKSVLRLVPPSRPGLCCDGLGGEFGGSGLRWRRLENQFWVDGDRRSSHARGHRGHNAEAKHPAGDACPRPAAGRRTGDVPHGSSFQRSLLVAAVRSAPHRRIT